MRETVPRRTPAFYAWRPLLGLGGAVAAVASKLGPIFPDAVHESIVPTCVGFTIGSHAPRKVFEIARQIRESFFHRPAFDSLGDVEVNREWGGAKRRFSFFLLSFFRF